MPSKRERDELLAVLILRRTEPSEPPDGHLDDNVLALLELGAASPEELLSIEEHLAICPRCRKLAGEAIQGDIIGFWTRSRFRIAALGLAASLLVAVGLFVVLRSDGRSTRIAQAEAAIQSGDATAAIELLRPMLIRRDPTLTDRSLGIAQMAYSQLMNRALIQGDFGRVESLADDASRLGVRSPELASLRSQAIRRMPGLLALVFADRLDRFGIPLQAPLGKAIPSEVPTALKALQVLEITDPQSATNRESYLNRAHAMLVSQPRAASQLFETWLNDHPDDTDALLGRGLAEYLTGDYAASASPSRPSVRHNPGESRRA